MLSLVLLAVLGGTTEGLAREKTKWCSRAHARQLVHDFIDAYNEGNLGRLDAIIATEPDFGFFRVSPERDSRFAEDRSTLIPYFRERHDLDDQLELVDFRLNSKRGSSPSNIWGFGLKIRRTSDDILPWGNATFVGKGAADCTIVAWNIHWP